jgi:hypothetical protein
VLPHLYLPTAHPNHGWNAQFLPLSILTKPKKWTLGWYIFPLPSSLTFMTGNTGAHHSRAIASCCRPALLLAGDQDLLMSCPPSNLSSPPLHVWPIFDQEEADWRYWQLHNTIISPPDGSAISDERGPGAFNPHSPVNSFHPSSGVPAVFIARPQPVNSPATPPPTTSVSTNSDTHSGPPWSPLDPDVVLQFLQTPSPPPGGQATSNIVAGAAHSPSAPAFEHLPSSLAPTMPMSTALETCSERNTPPFQVDCFGGYPTSICPSFGSQSLGSSLFQDFEQPSQSFQPTNTRSFHLSNENMQYPSVDPAFAGYYNLFPECHRNRYPQPWDVDVMRNVVRSENTSDTTRYRNPSASCPSWGQCLEFLINQEFDYETATSSIGSPVR